MDWKNWVEQDCKTFKVSDGQNEYDARLFAGCYESNGNLAVLVYYFDPDMEDWDLWNDLTVNTVTLAKTDPNKVSVALDTNNYSQGPDLVQRLGIGTFESRFVSSGYCSYPVFSFDVAQLRLYDPLGVAEYEQLSISGLGR